MGAGFSKDFLEPKGFINSQSIITNEDLSLHHTDLDEGKWLIAYAEYADATKYGVL